MTFRRMDLVRMPTAPNKWSARGLSRLEKSGQDSMALRPRKLVSLWRCKLSPADWVVFASSHPVVSGQASIADAMWRCTFGKGAFP